MATIPVAQKKGLWSETLAACRECLEIDRRFAAQLERQIAEPDQDPMEPTIWEHFIAARKDLFDYTVMNLGLLSQNQTDPAKKKPIDPLENQIREDLLTSLVEMMTLEGKLTDYLSKNLGVIKETIDNLAKSQALFSGYASLEVKPPATLLDSLA
jgi:type I site-specific restriction endonuclease